MSYYGGLDVSLETVSVCIVDEMGKVIREAVKKWAALLIFKRF